MAKILTTYEIWTPEEEEFGLDHGWIDEEGYEFEPDEYDYDEFIDENELPEDTPHADIRDAVVAELALEFLRDVNVGGASSTHFHHGVWYSNLEHDTDYRTGAIEQRSYHLEEFTPEQEEYIFMELK